MIISAHQPAYNPWLGYFHKVLLSDIFVVMDDVQFEKNSFINRNKIYQKPDGLMLTIPCGMKDYKSKRIKDIEISNSLWKIKHLKAISQTYSKSPYYKDVFPFIEKALSQESTFFVDYSNKIFIDIIDYLNIKTKIIYSSTLDIESRKLDYVIELTKKTKGDRFVFGSLGKDYADEVKLLKEGIKPYFQDYLHPEYNQNKNGEFIPYLGIFDVLFNVPKEQIIDLIMRSNVQKHML